MDKRMAVAALPVLALFSILLVAEVMGKNLPSRDIDLFHNSNKRLYLPVAISADAVLAALRAQVQSDGGALENALERKRTSAEMNNPLASFDSAPIASSIKRKMFWQPLGYMSASARRHNQANNINRETSADSGSSVFRYG